jgi:agmatinase
METSLTVPPKQGHKTLLYATPAPDLDALDAHIAVLGIPFGSPYSLEDVTNDQTNAPTAVRQASDRVIRSPERYDFDIGGPLLGGRNVKFVDCGDVRGDPRDLGTHSRNAEQAVRKILAAGAMPIVIGGDHGVTIPALRGFVGRGPITLVHIDAHLDWRNEVNGVKDGLSSPIRRASEMEHIGEIYQIGIRAQGSAREEELDAALAYGSHIVTAYELHDVGMDAIIARIPDGGRYYLTVDADGMDPTEMPAVYGPAPGGVTFIQMRKLIHALVKKGRVVGMDIVEITPKLDVNRITCITAGRLIVNLIGAVVRANYFETA